MATALMNSKIAVITCMRPDSPTFYHGVRGLTRPYPSSMTYRQLMVAGTRGSVSKTPVLCEAVLTVVVSEKERNIFFSGVAAGNVPMLLYGELLKFPGL